MIQPSVLLIFLRYRTRSSLTQPAMWRRPPLLELLEATSYFPFFLRSAQRFFIANDKRLLPSSVIPQRRRPVARAPPARFFVTGDDDAIPSRASIARTIRSLSALRCRSS